MFLCLATSLSMYSIMSSTITSLFLAFYTAQLRKGIDTYRDSAALALSKPFYEPDQALPCPISTSQRATLMRRMVVVLIVLIRDLGVLMHLYVLTQGVNDLVILARGGFYLLTLKGGSSFTVLGLTDGMGRMVVLTTQR